MNPSFSDRVGSPTESVNTHSIRLSPCKATHDVQIVTEEIENDSDVPYARWHWASPNGTKAQHGSELAFFDESLQ
jgi:hypothetical protein